MRVHRGHSNWYALALIAAVAMVAAMDASARGVRVASSPIFDTSTGESWDPVNFLVPGTDALPFAITDIGFALNYGQAVFDPIADSRQIKIYENGYVSFEPGFTDPVDGSGAIAENVAAPLLLNSGIATNLIDYAPGLVDLTLPYAQSDAVKAFRVTWFAGATDNFPFQLVLLDRGAGDFDMEFNYGSSFDDPPVDAPSDFLKTAGFNLGPNEVGPLAGPFNSAQSYFWSFRDGALTTTPTTPVPEPSSLALIGAGLVMLAVAAYRRRRAGQPSR